MLFRSGLVQDVGRVSQSDIEATLNMGIGMVVLLPESEAAAAVHLLGSRGLGARVIGTTTQADAGTPRVRLVGAHA